jgi:hypothetical protein
MAIFSLNIAYCFFGASINFIGLPCIYALIELYMVLPLHKSTSFLGFSFYKNFGMQKMLMQCTD